MVTGPLRGRFSIAVRPIRPAQPASWPWPVFTEITCALTPARYSTPQRWANRFRAWLSWDSSHSGGRRR